MSTASVAQPAAGTGLQAPLLRPATGPAITRARRYPAGRSSHRHALKHRANSSGPARKRMRMRMHAGLSLHQCMYMSRFWVEKGGRKHRGHVCFFTWIVMAWATSLIALKTRTLLLVLPTYTPLNYKLHNRYPWHPWPEPSTLMYMHMQTHTHQPRAGVYNQLARMHICIWGVERAQIKHPIPHRHRYPKTGVTRTARARTTARRHDTYRDPAMPLQPGQRERALPLSKRTTGGGALKD